MGARRLHVLALFLSITGALAFALENNLAGALLAALFAVQSVLSLFSGR